MSGKKTEVLHFDTKDGNSLELPVAFVVGAAPGPNAVITAGLHGGGFSGIFAAIRLFQELSPADIKGTVKFITLSDRAAFESGNESLELRCEGITPFSNLAYANFRQMLVAKVIDEIKGSDYHIDLNTTHNMRVSIASTAYHRGRRGDLNDMSHEIAYYFGMPNIMITESERADGVWTDNKAFYAKVYERVGIPSALSLAPSASDPVLNEKNIRCHVNGVVNVLRRFGTMKGTAVTPTSRPQIYEGMEWLFSKEAGLYVSVVKIGEKVRRGQMIGYIADSFGTPIEKIIAPISGHILSLSRNVSIEKRYFVASIGIPR